MALKENADPLDRADFQLIPKKKPHFMIYQNDDDKYDDIVSSLNLDIRLIIFAVVCFVAYCLLLSVFTSNH